MKKYLMTGIAALAMIAGFTSCSSNDDLYDPDLVAKNEAEQAVAKIVENYNATFIKVFGQPAATQTWGFGAPVTRTSQPERNLWYDPDYFNLEQPADITAAEARFVMNWFATHTKADGTTLDVKNYFVQQVGYGGHVYTVKEKKFEVMRPIDGVDTPIYQYIDREIPANGHMDQLYVNLDSNGEKSEHIYNFNNNSGDIMYMNESETKFGFGFCESYGTDKTHVYQNYLLAHIVGTADDGSKVDGYYVGFDYQTQKNGDNQEPDGNGGWKDYVAIDLQPDGKYDDRVVKIVPAKTKIPTTPSLRVFAEDLSANEASDFDFNDVVFDALYVSASKVKVIVRAAGGTLPLRVDGNEVHSSFVSANSQLFKTAAAWDKANNSWLEGLDVDEQTMINTGARRVKPELPYKAADNFNAFSFEMTNYDDWSSNQSTFSGQVRDRIKVEVNKGGNWIELKAPVGAPACKVAVSISTNWKAEKVSLGEGFARYVVDPTYDWFNTND